MKRSQYTAFLLLLGMVWNPLAAFSMDNSGYGAPFDPPETRTPPKRTAYGLSVKKVAAVAAGIGFCSGVLTAAICTHFLQPAAPPPPSQAFLNFIQTNFLAQSEEYEPFLKAWASHVGVCSSPLWLSLRTTEERVYFHLTWEMFDPTIPNDKRLHRFIDAVSDRTRLKPAEALKQLAQESFPAWLARNHQKFDPLMPLLKDQKGILPQLSFFSPLNPLFKAWKENVRVCSRGNSTMKQQKRDLKYQQKHAVFSKVPKNMRFGGRY